MTERESCHRPPVLTAVGSASTSAFVQAAKPEKGLDAGDEQNQSRNFYPTNNRVSFLCSAEESQSSRLYGGEMCRPHLTPLHGEVEVIEQFNVQLQKRLAASISRWFRDERLTAAAAASVRSSLRNRSKLKEQDMWTCCYCNYSTVSPRERRFHLLVHKRSGDSSCVDCGACFGGLRGLKQHRTTVRAIRASPSSSHPAALNGHCYGRVNGHALNGSPVRGRCQKDQPRF